MNKISINYEDLSLMERIKLRRLRRLSRKLASRASQRTARKITKIVTKIIKKRFPNHPVFELSKIEGNIEIKMEIS